ncbi:MAG TPA: TonB family protein [Acidobacteriota bacterium]|nr:TonB family protein [Acidobacteriota bacterium]
MRREKRYQFLIFMCLLLVIEATQVGLVTATSFGQKQRRRTQSKRKKVAPIQKMTPSPEQNTDVPGDVKKTTDETPAKENSSNTTQTDSSNAENQRYNGVIRGNAIYKVTPDYPREARNAGISGDVVVRILISQTGDVIEAKAEGGPPELHEAAVQAALQWKFKPTLLNNEPVKVTGILTFRFSL